MHLGRKGTERCRRAVYRVDLAKVEGFMTQLPTRATLPLLEHQKFVIFSK
jgi:hypothetical protein